MPTFKKQLEGLPANPALLFQLNLGKFLLFITAAEEIAWLGPEMTAFTEKIGALFASFTVGEDTAWLKVTLSPEEKPIEAVARVAPLIFLTSMPDGNSIE